jgi:adenine-specific DNA-methyltransferase
VAKIEDLVKRISDEKLRDEIAAEVRELKKHKQFGLVFEEHLPEMLRLPKVAIRVGNLVVQRGAPGNDVWRVIGIKGKSATCRQPINPGKYDEGKKKDFPLAELVLVVSFGEPIYPILTPVDRVARGEPDKPWHILINADNYHALQLLLYSYERKVDVIYIDPPYNTGARDWKYNNDYVDAVDVWRHSKWLSMMKKRLVLAKRLLRRDGVIIVTIDENEAHHLAVLLNSIFPEARIQMVTICVNPSGVSGKGLSRVEEYAFFCALGNQPPNKTPDDMLTSNSEELVRWESLMRGGNVWYREERPNLCYPIAVDSIKNRIVAIGEPFSGHDENRRPRELNGYPVAWPVRLDGKLGIWRVEANTLLSLAEKGFAYVSSRNDERETWTIRYLMTGTLRAIEAGTIRVVGRGERGEALLESDLIRRTIAKTVWNRGRHTAGGAGGTYLLQQLLGERNLFSFPKSVYAVIDCLSVAAGDKKNAVICDFFAGSGTTAHAAMLMNRADFGRRRTISVTNNEVSEARAYELAEKTVFPGQSEYEKSGIADRVTWPRLKAAITGVRPDGVRAEGNYSPWPAFPEDNPIAEGLRENLEYFRLDFVDPARVERGDAFEGIMPILWMMAGAIGERESRRGSSPWYLAKYSPFAVLIQETKFRDFTEKLGERKQITHVFLVTDSEDNFALMRAELGRKFHCVQLYKSYLNNFRINTVDCHAAGIEPE